MNSTDPLPLRSTRRAMAKSFGEGSRPITREVEALLDQRPLRCQARSYGLSLNVWVVLPLIYRPQLKNPV
jgi:hypothetical protein